MYALIKNNVVENVIEADADFAQSIAHEWGSVQPVTLGQCGIGWTFDGEFTPPPAPTPEPVKRHISVGQFFDSFGDQKYPILSSTDAMVKALILDCQVRSYIDLDNTRLPGGLAMLVAKGFPIDPQAIINQAV